MIHLLPPCRVRWGGSTSWSFPTLSSPPFLCQHQKLWMLAWPLSGDEPKAGSNDHLHYIKIVIPRLVFYYIVFFLKKEKIADDSKNESFWLFVCLSISWSILALSVFFSPLDCGHLEDKRHVLLALVSSFLSAWGLSNISTKLKSNIKLIVVLLNSAIELNWGIIQMENLHTFMCVLNIDSAVDLING